jgi:hypothetical protein
MKNTKSATKVRSNLWRLMFVIGGLSLFLLSYSQYVNAIITEEEDAARVAAEEKEKMNVTWTVYNNSEYGISMKYPAVMGEPKIYGSNDEDESSSTGNYQLTHFYNYDGKENPYMRYMNIQLEIYPAVQYDKTLRQFMNEDFFARMLDLPLGSPKIVNVSGDISGLEYTTVIASKYVGFVYDDYIYVLGSEETDSAIGKLVYDEILNSIQLFEPITDDDEDKDEDKEDDEDDNEQDESDN